MEDGFYWVKLSDEEDEVWTVAEWVNARKEWYLTEFPYRVQEMFKIGPKIEPPEDK